MSAPTAKPRRPKPLNLDRRKTLRYDREVEEAVAQLQRSVSRSTGGTRRIDFSKAVRILVVENYEAARLLAGEPEAWPTSHTVELPRELWDALTECRNRLSHSQGSLYTIMRKLNFDDGPVTRDEARAAFDAVQESKAAVARVEDLAVQFVLEAPGEAGAEPGAAAG